MGGGGCLNDAQVKCLVVVFLCKLLGVGLCYGREYRLFSVRGHVRDCVVGCFCVCVCSLLGVDGCIMVVFLLEVQSGACVGDSVGIGCSGWGLYWGEYVEVARCGGCIMVVVVGFSVWGLC